MNVSRSVRPPLPTLGAAILRALLAATAVVLVAQRQPLVHAQPAQAQVVDLPASRIAAPRSELRRQLARLAQLADEQRWDEAVAVADELLATPADGWMSVAPDRFAGIRAVVHRQIAAWPPAGLAAYRARVDAAASDWLRAGVDHRDESQLRLVLSRVFCSQAGDDALWALGDVALQRGECQAARAAWQAVRPETAAGAIAYPDSSIALAAVRSRLALVSIREGDFDRARQEIDELAAHHSDASGRLGGRRVNYAKRLGELLIEAREWPPRRGDAAWPTLGARQQRTSVAATAIPKDATFHQAWTVPITPRSGGDLELTTRSPTFPVASHGVVAYQDGGGVQLLSLAADPPAARSLVAMPDVHDFTAAAMTIADRRLLAIVPAKSRGAASPVTQLVVFDLARDGALHVQLAPGPGAIFVGAPIVSGSRMVVCEITPPPEMKTSLVCFDLWTQAVTWRRTLCWPAVADDQTAWLAARASLAADGGAVFVNTNLGVVAAVAIADGEPLWLRTYPRTFPADPTAVIRAHQGLPDAPAAARSRLLVLPSDAAHLLALDAVTGASLWSAPRPADAVRLLAVDDDRALLAGERLTAIRVATGAPDAAWNCAALGGAGQGAVAGELVLWPAPGEIHLVDRATGQSAGDPLPLPWGGGANLIVTADADGAPLIVAAGADRVTAFRATANASNPRYP